MTTSTTTINDNNTTTDLTLTTMTVSATVNLNNSSGDDSVTTDGTGTTTVNANNSSGDDTITVNNAGSATVNLNNSTGSDDVDISDVTGSPLSATVNLNNSTGVDDNVSIAGTTVNATVNLNSSGQKGYNDDVSVTGANVTATVNLNNSLGNDDITIVGTSSTNATVNLNNSGGNDNVTIGSTTGATTATVNLNSSGGTDIVNIVGATTTATVSLTNSTGKGDVIKLVGQGTGKIDATNSIGNDTLIGANSTDTITGGIGNDTVDLEGAGTINAGAGNDLGIYTLSDHYSLSGGVLQSIHGDVDYYYGQAGTNTLRLVLTQDQANLAAVQVDLAAYSGFLATHPSADQTYTFHFGAAAGALTVAGWQTLQTAVVTPVISGTAREGQTLTASVTVTGGETGTATYQWQISANGSTGWANIAGATGSTYTPNETNENHYLRVQAVFTDGIGETVTATSTPTAAVLDAAPTITTPTITGTVQEGQTLTASASAGQSDNPVTYAWYSSADNYANPIGSGPTYLVKEGDESFTIEVKATATNDNGVTASATGAATSAVLDAAPTITTPTITGTVQEGQTLTASASAGQSDNPVTYAWYSSADNYANPIGSGPTYLVKEGDETHTIEVKATATNDNGVTISATSAVTGAVLDAAPTITTPTITGTVQEGQTLTASASTGQGDNPVTYAWYSSADGYTGVIGTGSTYLVKEGDETHTIEVKATATNDNGVTASATGAATSAVLDAAPTITTPTITGTVQEGQTLTASASSGQGDNPVTYAWYSSADGYTGVIGTGSTYLVKEGDETHTIEVKATATNDNGVTISATSTPTAAVLDAAPTVTTPTISGTVQEGQTLTALASAGQGDNPVTYAWYSSADGYTGVIGTGSTYLVKEGDETHTIDVVATATNDNGVTISATSTPTAAVLDAAPTITTPTITGTVQEGQTLTASASTGQSDNPVTYAWYSSADGYTGVIGTGSTYLVKEGDETHTIEVKATATNDNGVTASATGAATSAVLDAAPTITTPTITGTVQEGQTLTASASSGQGDNPVTYAWYSSADGYTGVIGTGSTYLVKEGDETHTIEVKATATNDNGVTISATSTPTAAVLDAAPTVTTPTISGTVQEGQTLTASASTGQGDNPVTYAWYSSADGYTGVIGTGSTYLVKEGDETHTIEVKATATNDNGVTASATGAATSAVLDATPTITTPTITGTVQEGQTLTASATAGQSDNPVTYAWYSSADNYANPIGSGPTYLVKEGDESFTIEVKATATNDNGVTASATGAATSAMLDAAPTITTPTITGTVQEGQTLTASASAGQSDNPVTYAWYSSADNYANPIGSGPTYLVKEGDETHTIEVKATATNDNGVTISATSAVTGAVLDAAPTITTPTITGTVQEGQTLTASATAGQGDNPMTYAWYSSADGYTGVIGTGSTYVVKEGDETHTIEVKATATNDNGVTISATSTPTAAVLDAAPTVTTPTISGTVQEGQTLTASASAGQGDNPVTYAWYSSADGYTGVIGTGSTYLVKEGDETHTIEVKATATNDNGVTASATSAPTGAVSDITLIFTTPASVSGTAKEGQVLSAVNGTLNDSDAAVTGYQWTRDGANISSATSASYTVVEADEGHVLRVVETATDSDGGPAATSTSAPTAAVTDIALAFTTAALISGTAKEGSVLSAVNGTLNDTDASVTGYQWQISSDSTNWSNINGATASTYSPVETDETKFLRVVETATDSDGGPAATSTSAPTAAVTDITLAFTTAASISGTAKEGSVLSAVNGTLNDTDASVTGYQWQISSDGTNWSNINGATASTYTPVETDETKFLRVIETATDADGGPAATSTSAPTGAVSDITLIFTTPASISGTAKEGQVLSAVNGTLNDSDAAVTGYQWTRDGANISSATSASYTVVEADEGHVLRVVETATDSDGGPAATSTSAPTAAVTEISLMPSITAGTNNGANGNNNATATFTVTFAEAVTGVTTSDFALFGTATTTSVTSVSASSGTSFTVTVNYTSHNGSNNVDKSKSLGLNFVNTGNAVHDSETGESGNLAVATNITTPEFSSLAPAGIAGSPIDLGLSDPSGIGAITTLTVSGMPAGWSLSQGTQNADGSWTVTTSDPSSLYVTTPATFAGAMALNVSESWTNADGTAGNALVNDNVEAYPASPIFAVSGDDTLTGGTSANNEFVFAQPVGNDKIYNFTAGRDTIDLIGFGLSGYGDLAIANDGNGNAVVTLGSGETITLRGIDATALSASNFVFDTEPVSTNSGTMMIRDGAILPLGGTITNSGTIAINSTGDESDLEILVRGATLQGGGQVVLSDSSQNVVFGGDPSAVLDNVDNTISGAGQFGNGTLTLQNEGVIEATGANALVIDTRANAIVNTGTLAASGAGGLVVNSALTGGGNAKISGSSSLEFGAASDAKVSFDTGATGTLKLDQAGAFTGTVAGFTGYNAIDLANLVDGDQATIGYAATADNSGGTLTLGDAAQTHSVSLALLGQYAAASDFAVASDGHGGTLVTRADPSQNHALTLANSSH